MQVDRSQIENGLAGKGFVEEQTHHRYFYHEYKGKRTGIHTYTSHGSKYKAYGVELLKQMKKQLRLDTVRQVVELCNCPMTGKRYNEVLRRKGLLAEPQPVAKKPKGK